MKYLTLFLVKYL